MGTGHLGGGQPFCGQTSGLLSLAAFKVETQGQLPPVQGPGGTPVLGEVAPSRLGSSRGLWMILFQLDNPMGGPGSMVAK